MHFIKIPKLNLIVGWNSKVACTTIFHLLLTKLGHPIQGNIHIDMLTKVNLKSGKYGIYELDPELDDENIENYTKICVIRNPYARLISGIRQRSWFFIHDFKKLDVSKNTITEFLENLKTHNYIEKHFFPQTKNLNDLKFDHILEIDDMSKLYNILDLPYTNKKIGGHDTNYESNHDKVVYYNLTIQDIYDRFNTKWSPNIKSWFTSDNIKLINELYKDDFDWLHINGFDYKLE